MESETKSAGFELIFKDIRVTIDKREIIKGVSGLAKPGEMLAIMGPSGAGKTTLLNCLAGRKQINSGQILLNNRPMNKQMRRKVSYVLQSDIFLSEISTWDTIWYSALLRLPDSMPVEEKKKRVNRIIDALDMRKCLKTKIGDDLSRGLSGGEKKRTNIACELLTNPALMLLDEPTSGLDSSTAYSLITTLKQFARKSGITVVMTIHQPSSQIFNMFDKLFLLCEGQVAYYGDVSGCADYFAEIGIPCPPNYNLADHILDRAKDTDEIKAKLKARALLQKEESWYPKQLLNETICEVNVITESLSALSPDITADSNVISMNRLNTQLSNQSTQQNTGYVNGSFVADNSTNLERGVFNHSTSLVDTSDDLIKYKKDYDGKWPTGFWTQYSVLTKRAFWQAYPRILSKWNIIQVVVVAVFIGLLWFQTEPTEEKLPDRLGLLFFTLIFNSFMPLIDAISGFPAERVVLNKERLGGYYRLSAYYLSKSITELLLVLILPTIFIIFVYWMTGLNLSFSVFIQILLMNFLSAMIAQAIGFFYGALILDVSLGIMCATTTMLLVMLAGGYYVQEVPFWAEWLRYLSFVQFLFYSVTTIDFTHIDIKCAAVGSKFQSCIDANSTEAYIPRQELLDSYTLSSSGWELYQYIIWLISVMFVIRVATYLVLRFIRKPRAA